MFPGGDPTVALAPATFAPVLGSPAAAKAELTIYNFLPEALSAQRHWFLRIVNLHLWSPPPPCDAFWVQAAWDLLGRGDGAESPPLL